MSEKIIAVIPDALIVCKRVRSGNKNGEKWRREEVQIRTKSKTGEESTPFLTVSDKIEGLYESLVEDMRGIAEVMISVTTAGFMRTDLLAFESVKVSDKGVKV